MVALLYCLIEEVRTTPLYTKQSYYQFYGIFTLAKSLAM